MSPFLPNEPGSLPNGTWPSWLTSLWQIPTLISNPTVGGIASGVGGLPDDTPYLYPDAWQQFISAQGYAWQGQNIDTAIWQQWLQFLNSWLVASAPPSGGGSPVVPGQQQPQQPAPQQPEPQQPEPSQQEPTQQEPTASRDQRDVYTTNPPSVYTTDSKIPPPGILQSAWDWFKQNYPTLAAAGVTASGLGLLLSQLGWSNAAIYGDPIASSTTYDRTADTSNTRPGAGATTPGGTNRGTIYDPGVIFRTTVTAPSDVPTTVTPPVTSTEPEIPTVQVPGSTGSNRGNVYDLGDIFRTTVTGMADIPTVTVPPGTGDIPRYNRGDVPYRPQVPYDPAPIPTTITPGPVPGVDIPPTTGASTGSPATGLGNLLSGLGNAAHMGGGAGGVGPSAPVVSGQPLSSLFKLPQVKEPGDKLLAFLTALATRR